MKKIYINSAGCNENLLDGEILKSSVRKAGLALVNDPRAADLIVYNTCAFKKEQEDIAVRAIRKFQRIKKKNAELVVCGCIVKINNERFSRVFKGRSFSPSELIKFSTILGADDIGRTEEATHISRDSFSGQIFNRQLLDKIYAFKNRVRDSLGISILPKFDILDFLGDENTFFLRIARGCINSCAYCAVRFAQGPLISMPLNTVLEKIKGGVSDGYKHIFLSATNISVYGKDIGTDFLNALERITAIEGDYRITIHNLEPFVITEEPQRFLKIVSSPKISAIYCPINSGSQRILDRMKRGYDIGKVTEVLRALRKNNPRLIIRTEFIVGYPGETWKDFYKTILLIAKFKFDLIDLHYYSPRPNIAALSLDNQKSSVIKYLRHAAALLLTFFRVWLPKLRPL